MWKGKHLSSAAAATTSRNEKENVCDVINVMCIFLLCINNERIFI